MTAARPPYGRPAPTFQPRPNFGSDMDRRDGGPTAYQSPGLDAQAPTLFRPDEEELIAGRRPVEEAFVARRPAHRLLIVPQRRQALERLVLHATSLRIPVVEVEGGTLTALAGFDGHQGVALAVAPRRFADIDEILARAIERGEPPLVLVLDSLEDPQNLGTLLRSAEAAGAHGVIFPTRRQAPLSPSAIKASAGATEHLLLAPVDDLAGALADLRVRGLRIAGAEADAPMTARQADLRGPLAIVIGSEGHGLSPIVRRRCDLAVRIPLRGAVGSLNAAVAGSILLFEAVSQRDPDDTGGGPRVRRASGLVEPPPEALSDSPAEADDPDEAVGSVEAAAPQEAAAPDEAVEPSAPGAPTLAIEEMPEAQPASTLAAEAMSAPALDSEAAPIDAVGTDLELLPGEPVAQPTPARKARVQRPTGPA